jgi:glyoxylase-like metal-dependent hydrolase (beta-lactamase superfamily II)
MEHDELKQASHRTIDVLLGGFFGRSNRGFLGWSAIYLVTTPSGRRLLFDTGGYNERGTIPKLLQERGLGVTSINCVVLSHLHFDHAANWDLFPKADLVPSHTKASETVDRREALGSVTQMRSQRTQTEEGKHNACR